MSAKRKAGSRKGRPVSILNGGDDACSSASGPTSPMRKRTATLSSQLSLLVSRRNKHIQVSRPVYSQQSFDEGFHPGRRGGASPHHTLATFRQSLARRFACTRQRLLGLVLGFFPFVANLRGYSVKDALVGDILAGITVGITNVPQGMGYAILASLPPVYGLYVSFFPPLIYFLFGTSRHNSIGVFAVASMMIASSIDIAMLPRAETSGATLLSNSTAQTSPATTAASSPLASTEHTAFGWFSPVGGSGSNGSGPKAPASAPLNGQAEDLDAQQRVVLACSLSLLVGLMQVLMGVLKLGFVTIYLSDSLISGFTTGVACHIFTSQIPSLLGIKVDRFNGPLKVAYTYASLFSRITTIKVVEPVMGIIALGILVAVKEGINEKFKKKMKMPIPIELILVIAATMVSYFFNLDKNYKVKVVGNIPAGFAVPEVPEFHTFGRLVSSAFALAVVIFAVSVSLAKTFAKRNNYEVDANQELIAYGMTNAVSSFFGCFPSCSSLSRSAIQENQGGKTQVASIISAILILVVLLWMGPLLEALPGCILAAIIIVGLKGTFMQFNQLKPLWIVAKHDFAIWMVTFTAVVIIDVDIGLLIAVAFGLLTVVFRSQTAYTCLLGRIPHTDLYKDKSVYNTVEELQGVRVFRMDSPLHYINVEHFRHKLYKLTGINPRQLLEGRNKVQRELDIELATAAALTTGTAAQRQRQMPCRSCTARFGHFMGATCCRSAKDAATIVNNELSLMVDHTHVVVGALPVPPEQSPDWPACSVQFIVIDCSTMSYVDLAGINTLRAMYDEYKKVGIGMLFANCKAGVRQMFARSELYATVPKTSVYVTIHDAVIAALQQLNDDKQLDKYQEDIIAGSTAHIAPFADQFDDVYIETTIAELPIDDPQVAGTDSGEVMPLHEESLHEESLHEESLHEESLHDQLSQPADSMPIADVNFDLHSEPQAGGPT